jgi:hypothetical protein
MAEQFAGCYTKIWVFLKTLHQKVSGGLNQVSKGRPGQLGEPTAEIPSGRGGWSSFTMANSAGMAARL